MVCKFENGGGGRLHIGGTHNGQIMYTHRWHTHWANYVHIGGTHTHTGQIIYTSVAHKLGKLCTHRWHTLANYVHIGGTHTAQIMYT